MIVDFHIHCFSPDLCRDRRSYMKDGHFGMLYADQKARLVSHEEVLAACDDSGVDIAVAMGFPWIDQEICREQNEYLASLSGLTGGRMRAFGSVPLSAGNSTEQWIGEIAESGLDGIGEVAFYGSGMTDDNEAWLRSCLEGARKFGLAVNLHVNEPVGHAYQGKYEPSLGRLYSVLKDFQDLTVILSHWGGGIFVYELMPEIMQEFRNFYYDTAATPYLYRDDIYASGVDIIGSKRVLFGSDFPLIKQERYIETVRAWTGSPEKAENILGGNAARLLKLEK